MKKLLIATLTVFTLALVATPASAKVDRVGEVIDTIDVQANSSTPVYTPILEDGVEYTLNVSGTAYAGDGIEFDAKYSYRTPTSTEWTDLVNNYHSYGPTLLDLLVDGNSDWGLYDNNHEYSMTVVGNDTALELYIYDVYYPNNTGYLTVEVVKSHKNHGQWVRSQENRQEAAQSRVGMPVQSKGHTK